MRIPTFLLLPVLFSIHAAAQAAELLASPPSTLVLGEFNPTTNFTGATLSMTFDKISGKLFVCSNGMIFRFSSRSQFTNGGFPEGVMKVHASQRVSGLALDSAGRMWASVGNRIVRFDNAAIREGNIEPDAVLGQPDYATNQSGSGQSGMNSPQAVAMDASGCLWVADTGNNRVIGFLNAAAKVNGAPADLLLGQPNWNNSGAGVASGRMTAPEALAVDGLGRLWVADKGKRVLRFDSATSKAVGAPADGVLGNLDFLGTPPTDPSAALSTEGLAADDSGRLYVYSSTVTFTGILRFDEAPTKPNGAPPNGKFSFSALAGEASPFSSVSGKTGNNLAIGLNGSLWAASVRARPSPSQESVLFRIDAPSPAADMIVPSGVLGSSSLLDASEFTLYTPSAITEDPFTGKVFIVDTGHHRVLRYASRQLLQTGSPAEAVFGQPDFATVTLGTGPSKMSGPRGSALDAAGNLYVSDSGNHRVLRFANAVSSPSGTPAVAALGQANLNDNSVKPFSEYTVTTPGPLAIGGGGELWIAELHPPIAKVIRYNQPATAPSGTPASGVLGRPDFYDQQTPSTSSSNIFRSVEALFCEPNGRLWVISTVNSSRYLYDLYRFDAAATKPEGAAAEGSSTLDLVQAASLTAPFSYSPQIIHPSLFLRPDGSLILFFQQYGVDMHTLATSPANNFVLRIADPVNLPSLVNNPADVDYVLSVPNPYPYSLSYTITLTLSASGTDGFWISDGNAGVSRHTFAPFKAPPQIGFFDPPLEKLLAISYASIPGRDYQLHTSSDLLGWVPGNTEAAKGTISKFVEPATAGRRYFKVIMLP